MCLSGGGGGAKTPTLDPVCIRETPEKMILWSLPPQMKNPRYGPEHAGRILAGYYGFNVNTRPRFQHLKISLLIPHIYVLGRFVKFLMIFRDK